MPWLQPFQLGVLRDGLGHQVVAALPDAEADHLGDAVEGATEAAPGAAAPVEGCSCQAEGGLADQHRITKTE